MTISDYSDDVFHSENRNFNDELIFNTNHIEFHTFSHVDNQNFNVKPTDEMVLNFDQTRPIDLNTGEVFYVSTRLESWISFDSFWIWNFFCGKVWSFCETSQFTRINLSEFQCSISTQVQMNFKKFFIKWLISMLENFMKRKYTSKKGKQIQNKASIDICT